MRSIYLRINKSAHGHCLVLFISVPTKDMPEHKEATPDPVPSGGRRKPWLETRTRVRQRRTFLHRAVQHENFLRSQKATALLNAKGLLVVAQSGKFPFRHEQR